MDSNVLFLTLVIALEPVPVLAGVLLLTTERGRPKAIAFGLGWAFALAIIGVASLVVGGQVSTSSGSTSSRASALLDVILGVALAAYALRMRAKGRRGTAQETPGWMKRLDAMRPITAFVLGTFLPPYLIAVSIGNQIVRSSLSSTQRAVAVMLYVVVGSIGILIPIMVTVIRPSTSDATISSWRAWLEAHWQAVLMWLFLAIGAYLIVKGIVELFH
jgi:hypothetical protein